MSSSLMVVPTAAFGFNLLRQEIQAKPGENVWVSPLSVSLALGMAALGARDETRRQMLNVLGVPASSDWHLNYAQLAKLKDTEDMDVQLTLANGLWAQEGCELERSFLDMSQRYFEATVRAVDFANPTTMNEINEWVERRTMGKIRAILDTLDPAQAVCLLNAIYFKGGWSNRFDRTRTKVERFHLERGETKNHPLMCRQGDMRYVQMAEGQLVALPFGLTEGINLYVFLPTQSLTRRGARSPVSTLDDGQFFEACQKLCESEGRLWLPRFGLDYKNDLQGSLMRLGMRDAFVSSADFTGIGRCEPPLYLSGVVHRATAKFDEEGGEAAAATVVSLRFLGSRHAPEEPWEMRVDRPFLAVIMDDPTQTMLFAGVVMNPEDPGPPA